MRSLRDVQPLADLVCTPDSLFSRDYDVLLDGERCGSLEWERGFMPRALAETEGSAWWIGRRGFGSSEHEMRVPGSLGAVATFRRRFFVPDEIVFADGRTFRWRRVRALLTLRYAIDRDGEELMQFSWLWSLLRRRARIEVWPAAARRLKDDDGAVLILFGSYLFIRLATAQSWG